MSVEGGAVLIGTCQALEGTFSSYFDTVTLLSLSHGWSSVQSSLSNLDMTY